MTFGTKITLGVLGASTIIGLSQTVGTDLLPIKPDQTILNAAANILLTYFLLALVIERGCEVAVNGLTALGLMPEKETDANGNTLRNPIRVLVSLMVCLAFSAAIAAAGLRMNEMILSMATPDWTVPSELFGYADAALTILILSGGAEGIHKMLRKILKDSPLPAT